MAELTQFLKDKGFTNLEGYCYTCPSQVLDLQNLCSNSNIKQIMEIGFNAGHSAHLFLSSNLNAELVSFDIGIHDYIPSAKMFIDKNYPQRHTLIYGDSHLTIPEFIEHNGNNKKFDLIFIDGSHDYEKSKSDFENCMKLAHLNTIVILDDTIFTCGWEREYTIGPTRVWLEYYNQLKITEIQRRDYSPGHGMSWGKYLL